MLRPDETGRDVGRGRGDSGLGFETAAIEEIRAQAVPLALPDIDRGWRSARQKRLRAGGEQARSLQSGTKTTPPPAAEHAGRFSASGRERGEVGGGRAIERERGRGVNGNAANDELSKKAADGFLINGTANNGAASPFATNPAFGNNRLGLKSLYTGNFGFSLDNSALDARPYSISGQDTPKQQDQ